MVIMFLHRKGTVLKVSDFKKKTIFLLVCVVCVGIAQRLGVTCIIKNLTGYICPGCGITRACLSALKLEIRKAWFYNPMFWSVPVLLCSFYFDGNLVKNRTVNWGIHIAILAGFIINWIIRLTNNGFIIFK